MTWVFTDHVIIGRVQIKYLESCHKYIAPEVLRGENYSSASDIYSFSIIMITFATGKGPWYDRAHHINLAKGICGGERSGIPDDTPKFYAELIRKYWNN